MVLPSTGEARFHLRMTGAIGILAGAFLRFFRYHGWFLLEKRTPGQQLAALE
jgi:hypothetical protein